MPKVDGVASLHRFLLQYQCHQMAIFSRKTEEIRDRGNDVIPFSRSTIRQINP
jgi:hypothetical protein